MSKRAGIWVKGGRLSVKEARRLQTWLNGLLGPAPRMEQCPDWWRDKVEFFLEAFCAMARAAGYRISVEDLRGPSRSQPTVRLRHIAMAIAYEIPGASLTLVGMAFHRDHGTVIHAKRAVESWLVSDARTRTEFVHWQTQLVGPKPIEVELTAETRRAQS